MRRYSVIYIYEKIENTSSCQEELTKDRREEEGSAKSYGIAKDSCLRRFCKEVGLYRNSNTGTFLNKEKQRFCRWQTSEENNHEDTIHPRNIKKQKGLYVAAIRQVFNSNTDHEGISFQKARMHLQKTHNI